MLNQEFQNLKNLFLKLGGENRLLKSMRTPSLQNEAKLRYEIRKLEGEALSTQVNSTPTKVEDNKYHAKADFKDYLSDYPSELHQSYIERGQCFLKACSLKIELNELSSGAEIQASKLQWEIWELFKRIDKYHKALKHWKENKRLLPTETKVNFTVISKTKWDLKRRNLRSNRSKRIKTINKIKSEMPDVEDPAFKLKQNQLNRKLEELAELDLQIEKLTELINDE